MQIEYMSHKHRLCIFHIFFVHVTQSIYIIFTTGVINVYILFGEHVIQTLPLIIYTRINHYKIALVFIHTYMIYYQLTKDKV